MINDVEKLSEFWGDLSEKLNYLIGMASVPAALHGGINRDIHQKLIDTAVWVDATLEGVE